MGDVLNAEQLAQRAVDLNLLDDRQLQQVWGEFGRQDISSDELVKALVRRELMTSYQVERMLKGERGGFFYGPYKVLYLVSAGSFARVYRAAHRESGQVVALKVLRKRFCEDPRQTQQFFHEGQRGRTLRHPNIVPIFEVVSSGRDHYLVMEFVEGHNLRDFLRIRKRIEPAEAVRLMTDTVAGMHYAFQRGIYHRDLKLTNVLVSSRGQARLVDFGLAGVDEQAADDTLAEGANPRTVDYAGLERATGVRNGDPRSDVYFLGTIFYHLLIGRAPLQETRDRIQRLSRQRFLDVVPIHRADEQLPRIVCLVVNRAMDLNPDRRYQSPGEMLVDLKIAAQRLADGTDIEALPGESGGGEGAIDDAERRRFEAMLGSQGQRRALMIVESNNRMQDLLRDGLKRCGYRVLLTSDPQRAMSRFEDGERPADCVIFSTVELGEAALEAFNRFGADEQTAKVPAMLLLGHRHGDWQPRAELAPHRVSIAMPLKLKQLRSLLARLVPPDANLAGEKSNGGTEPA